MKKKVFSLLLILSLLLSLAAPVLAADDCRVVIGADLSAEQIDEVYRLMGIERGSVTELTLTNAEERAFLQGSVDESMIGTNTISCVYFQLLPAGSGLSVETFNITWCTPDMIKSALVTAGVTDARIIVAAPVKASGTAAMAGICKAYEDITGEKLDAAAASAGTQELNITGELAEKFGDIDSLGILERLKSALGNTENMSDEELRSEIESVTRSLNVTLDDDQIRRIVDLFRTFEKMDPDALRSRVEQAKETVERIGEAKDKAVGFFERLRSGLGKVADFLDKVKGLFD